jgi:hypothetical protein
MMWRRVPNFAKQGRLWCSGKSFAMSPDALNSLFSLCIGFALAGALTSGYQALLQRPAGFGLLEQGAAPKTFAAVPSWFLRHPSSSCAKRCAVRGSNGAASNS